VGYGLPLQCSTRNGPAARRGEAWRTPATVWI
jgi:hypothetical protein